jgi:glutamate-1-semialdehyde aminotransferase
MGKGQELYKRAKKIIPGGTMLLSKRPEMFLPNGWPSYYSKTKGCEVWDLDGKKYTDVSIMGIGTNTLGYSNFEVDNAVSNCIKNGNMSTLNCPEEVLLAEKLIEINQWADMVRYARSGGEANAVAIRIARAASGKDKIAICGYHGWHDWYLSVNHNSSGDNLNEHLLPGLDPNGVPKDLKNTVFPFEYNNYEQLSRIVDEHDIGVIKMEVIRNSPPKNNFLRKVKMLSTKKNIVLIFDECTSAFRETFGGIHQKYDIEPDMAMYGKTLGNGYAITAVVGKKEVMEAAQKTFISSTFWTERIGPSAALKSLEVMEKEKSWEIISSIGKKIQNNWKKIANNYKIDIEVNGIPALSTFKFNHSSNLEFKTFLTQEFLERGYLGSTSFYASIAHNDEIMKKYFEVFDEIFFQISKCINGEILINDILKYPVSHSGFKRLN